MLVDKEGVEQHLGAVLAAEAAAAAGGREQRSGDENDGENAAAAAAAAHKRQRVTGVLGDATGRSRNGAAGNERRSRWVLPVGWAGLGCAVLGVYEGLGWLDGWMVGWLSAAVAAGR